MDARRALSLASGGVGEEQNKDSKKREGIWAYIILGGRQKRVTSTEWALPTWQNTYTQCVAQIFTFSDLSDKNLSYDVGYTSSNLGCN